MIGGKSTKLLIDMGVIRLLLGQTNVNLYSGNTINKAKNGENGDI